MRESARRKQKLYSQTSVYGIPCPIYSRISVEGQSPVITRRRSEIYGLRCLSNTKGL